VSGFVVIDDDQTGNCGEEGSGVERGVHVCALLLLLSGVCRLQYERALDEE
jgi:hypothetical protein